MVMVLVVIMAPAGRGRMCVALLWVVVVVVVIGTTPIDKATTQRIRDRLPEATESATGRACLPCTVAMMTDLRKHVSMDMRPAISTCAGDMDQTSAKCALRQLGFSVAVLRWAARRLGLARSVSMAITTGAAIVLLEI